jgi:hypothetical protein
MPETPINPALNLSPLEVLVNALDDGILTSSGTGSICCPVCGPYILASVETFLKYAEATGISDCCTNVRASVETYLKYAEAIGGSGACSNGFSAESTALLDNLSGEDRNSILDKGIVESGALNPDLSSSISDLTAMVLAFVDSTYNEEELVEMLAVLLDKGIVVSCFPGEIIVASVETYLKWAEAVG